jgi:hypothetical protein
VRLRRINPSLLKWGKITANFTLKISPTPWRKETKRNMGEWYICKRNP